MKIFVVRHRTFLALAVCVAIGVGGMTLAKHTGKGEVKVTQLSQRDIIEKLDEHVEIGFNEIIVLKELPQSLPPVRGIIIAKPSSPLSHINILAKGWNIPNVYICSGSPSLLTTAELWPHTALM